MMFDGIEITECGDIEALSDNDAEAVSGGGIFARESETQSRLFITYECDGELRTVTLLVNQAYGDLLYEECVRLAKSYIAVLSSRVGKPCTFVSLEAKPENV